MNFYSSMVVITVTTMTSTCDVSKKGGTTMEGICQLNKMRMVLAQEVLRLDDQVCHCGTWSLAVSCKDDEGITTCQGHSTYNAPSELKTCKSS